MVSLGGNFEREQKIFINVSLHRLFTSCLEKKNNNSNHKMEKSEDIGYVSEIKNYQCATDGHCIPPDVLLKDESNAISVKKREGYFFISQNNLQWDILYFYEISMP